jgi:hypothetical protein
MSANQFTVGTIPKQTGMLGTARRRFTVPAIFWDGKFLEAFKEGEESQAKEACADYQRRADEFAASGADYEFSLG